MISEAVKFERLIRSVGPGSFSEIEYDRSGHVVLRTLDMRTSDLGGTVRVYFDSHREQVLTGRRFDPMASNLLLLRPGVFYRVMSHIEITEPLPKGVSALVALDPEIADVMMITSAPMREGYMGPVYFTISPFRKIEVEKLTSLGTLMFFEDGVEVQGTLEGADDHLRERLEALEKRLEAMGKVVTHLTEGKLPVSGGDPEISESNRKENEQGPNASATRSAKVRTRVSRGDGDAAGSSSEQSGPSSD